MLKQVLAAIKKVAAAERIKPSDVTKAMFFSHITDISEWETRKLGGLAAIIKAHFPVEDKSLADIKEMNDAKSYVRKLEKRVAEKELFERQMLEKLEGLKAIEVPKYKGNSKAKTDRVLNLVLSDLHFGSDVNKEETGSLNYGRVEEARRLAKIVQEVCDYKKQHRDTTELNVLLLGDLIQGKLHDPLDGAEMAEQVARAIHLLNQALQIFAVNFKHVSIWNVSGNHDRDTSRHKGRAVNQKWDSVATTIAFALKTATAKIKNITFNIPKTPYISYTTLGHKIWASHGDSVLNAGYPGSSINTKSLEGQINKINASLRDTEEYSVFIVGHLHVQSTTFLSNGAVMVTNGALVPADEYAVSIGALENQCGQVLFETTKEYAVGDVRFIRVNKDTDKNTKLDNIIKKFESL